MESVDKLRKYADNYPKGVGNVSVGERMRNLIAFADEIEREIAGLYIPLPIDADGVPIKPGDVLDYTYPEKELWNGKTSEPIHVHETIEFIVWDGERWDFIDDEGEDTRDVENLGDFYRYARHAKPRTLEDALTDFAADAADVDGRDREEWEPLLAKYAAEIRELLGAD